VKTADEFLAAAKKTNSYVVQFTATWCTPCKQLAPVLERKYNEHKDKWTLIKVDVDAEGNSDVCSKFELQGVPTLVFIKDQIQVKKLVGNQPEKVLDAAIALLS
jgi:thioredoxin 1